MRRLVALLVAGAAFLPSAPTAEARMALPNYRFTKAAEGFGRVAEFECAPTFRAGTRAFAELVRNFSGYRYDGSRDCDSPVGSPTSQHKTGRAVDLFIDHRNSAAQDDGVALMQWLFARDAQNLRRLGVVEIIWGGRIWTTARDSDNVTWRLRNWRVFTSFGCPNSRTPTECHLDHIHITLSTPGSEKRSTFWTARATG